MICWFESGEWIRKVNLDDTKQLYIYLVSLIDNKCILLNVVYTLTSICLQQKIIIIVNVAL